MPRGFSASRVWPSLLVLSPMLSPGHCAEYRVASIEETQLFDARGNIREMGKKAKEKKATAILVFSMQDRAGVSVHAGVAPLTETLPSLLACLGGLKNSGPHAVTSQSRSRSASPSAASVKVRAGHL